MYMKVANTASAAPLYRFDADRCAFLCSKAPSTRDFAPDTGFPDTNMNGPDRLHNSGFEMINLGNDQWRINGIEVHGKKLKEAMVDREFVSGTEPNLP